MSSVYNDPAFKDLFAPRVKFEQIGDRARGTIAAIAIYEGNQQKSLQYQLTGVVAKQLGNQISWEKAELIAGSKNLLGQLIALQPQVGDQIDITLTELRPLPVGSAKLFMVQHQPALSGMPAPEVPPAASGDDDLFAG